MQCNDLSKLSKFCTDTVDLIDYFDIKNPGGFNSHKGRILWDLNVRYRTLVCQLIPECRFFKKKLFFDYLSISENELYDFLIMIYGRITVLYPDLDLD